LGNIPWGTYATVNGFLWFKDVDIEKEGQVWPNGASWFTGRKIYFTGTNRCPKNVETDAFSKFSVIFQVDSKPEKNCSLQAHYEGDNEFFDKCHSQPVYYSIVKHKTGLTLKVDDLRLNPLNTNNSANHTILEANQPIRIKGQLIDIDLGTVIENQSIEIETNLPIQVISAKTETDGKFQIDNLKVTSEIRQYYTKAIFRGNELYESTESDIHELQVVAKKEKLLDVIMTEENFESSTGNFDVFICHAYEDKIFARPLAEKLKQKGINVWYDEFTLHISQVS
jgi:hypothetical protein